MAYNVDSIFTFTTATSWGMPGRVDEAEQKYGPKHRPLFQHQRIAVVNVPPSDKLVAIPLRVCMRDSAVDSPHNPMHFLLPTYAESKDCKCTAHTSPLTQTRLIACYTKFHFALKLETENPRCIVAIGYAKVADVFTSG